MYFFILISLVVFLIFIKTIFNFFKYKQKEKFDKNSIYSLLRQNLSLEEALKKELSDLNKFNNIGLTEGVVNSVAEKISELQSMMDVDNVIEIYSTFIYRYIFRCGKLKNPHNIDETKLIRALYDMNFKQGGNGKTDSYFVLAEDKGEDFEKKYPN